MKRGARYISYVYLLYKLIVYSVLPSIVIMHMYLVLVRKPRRNISPGNNEATPNINLWTRSNNCPLHNSTLLSLGTLVNTLINAIAFGCRFGFESGGFRLGRTAKTPGTLIPSPRSCPPKSRGSPPNGHSKERNSLETAYYTKERVCRITPAYPVCK